MVKYLIYFFLTFLLSVLFTLMIKFLADKFGIVDRPDNIRKKHHRNIPLLGGTAIFVSFWLVILYLVNFTTLLTRHFSGRQLWAFFIAGAILMVVGFFDDKINLSSKWRLLFAVIAALCVLAGGVNFDGITNPFGGTIGLDFWKIQTAWFGTVLVGVDILAFLWLIGMSFTTKILDGLDGLSVGVSAIAALMIAFLSGGVTKFLQPDVALVALVFAGACLGFLIFNFYPAKIFLGEGGGLFLGLTIGVLAIIAGGKIATALLVMAVPIIDLVWVMLSRLYNHQAISVGDRRHLHFRLVDSGMAQWQAVLLLYVIAFSFGASTLFLESIYKLKVLIILVVCVLLLEIYVNGKNKR